MNRKRGKGSLKDTAIGLVWILVISGAILAFFQASKVTSIEEGINTIKSKAIEYAECIPAGTCGLQALIEDIDLSEMSGGGLIIDIPSSDGINLDFNQLSVGREIPGYRGPQKGEPYVNNVGLVNKEASVNMLDKLIVILSKDNVDTNASSKEGKDKDKGYNKDDVKYSRKEWKHWVNVEGNNCWNVRDAVLYRDAVPGSLVFLDKSRKETTDLNQACAIGRPIIIKDKVRIDTENSGEWICPYSGKKLTSASEVDIDHIIPLSYAAKHGGQSWSLEKKEIFANDLDNLLTTSAKENRSKGDKGPDGYMPPFKAYRCQYAKSYTSLLYKYELTINESDYKALDKVLKTCQH